MGHAEDARTHLGQARTTAGDGPEIALQLASVEATLAVAAAVEALTSTAANLSDAVNALRAVLEHGDVPSASADPTAPPTPTGPVNPA